MVNVAEHGIVIKVDYNLTPLPLPIPTPTTPLSTFLSLPTSLPTPTPLLTPLPLHLYLYTSTYTFIFILPFLVSVCLRGSSQKPLGSCSLLCVLLSLLHVCCRETCCSSSEVSRRSAHYFSEGILRYFSPPNPLLWNRII